MRLRLLVLLGRALLAVAGLSAALVGGSVAWGDVQPVPLLNQPLTLNQRVSISALASSALVNWSGRGADVTRITVTCAAFVLAHAAFRARSLASRWSWFKESVD